MKLYVKLISRKNTIEEILMIKIEMCRYAFQFNRGLMAPFVFSAENS